MNKIAFCDSTRLAFEVVGNHGYGLPYSSMFTSSLISQKGIAVKEFGQTSFISNLSKIIFREDSFEPVTKIRRGRLYRNIDQNPSRWYRYLDSNREITELHIKSSGDRSVVVFEPYIISNKEINLTEAIVSLGNEPFKSHWKILSIERIHTGEELLTLKSINSLGLLPVINLKKGTEKENELFEKKYEALARDLSSTPEAIIDHCRDVAAIAIKAAGFSDSQDYSDLGDLSNKLEKDSIAQYIAKILARLHARRKPSEILRRDLTELTYEDSDFALSCLGSLLRILARNLTVATEQIENKVT